jgi:undecaprenyl-diphosphatase
VQGLAEVVPVSSSAQLALLPWLAGWQPPPHRTAFAAALHAGSCAGIAWALREDLRELAGQPVRAAAMALSCLPATVVGLLVEAAVEARLGGPAQLAKVLAVAGAAHALADRRREDRTAAGGADLAAASVAQVAALVPGVSRLGAVLTVLRLRGVERSEAHRTALLLSLPLTAGAALLPLARADRSELQALAPLLAAGVPAAAACAGLAAAAQRGRPGRSAAAPTSYRLVLAAAVGARLHRREQPT